MSSSSDYEARLDLTADNRGVIKAFKQVSEEAHKTADGITVGSDESAAAMDKVREHTTMLRDTMVSLAGFVGVGGVAFGFKDLVEGGEKLQTSQTQLQQSLKDTGQDAGSTAADLERLAESMSTQGGFATTQNLSALTQFVSETKSATQAQKMLGLATEIARHTGADLASTQGVVAKAYDGQARGLQSLLGPMVAAKDASVGLSQAHAEEIAKIQETASLLSGPAKTAYEQQAELADHITAAQSEAAELSDKQLTGQQLLTTAYKAFAGDTASYSQNVQGEQSNLDHSVQNLSETFGKSLLPEMRFVVGAATDLADWMEKDKTEVEIVAAAVGGLTVAWGGMRILSGIKTMVTELGAAFLTTGEDGEASGILAAVGADTAAGAWRALMTTTIVGLVIVGLVELVEHWKEVEAVAVDAWHGIEAGAAAAWNWIKGHWPLLVEVLTGPVGIAVIEIVKHWHDIEDAATSVWHAIVSVVKDAVNEMKHLMGDLGFGGNGIMSYLNPVGLLGHLSEGGVVPEYHAAGGAIGDITVPEYRALGGTVEDMAPPEYRALGGPMVPLGTDTVPAMLTPGEGVVDTTGMRILGPQGLSALNAGQTGALGYGGGGTSVSVTPSNVTLNLNSEVLAKAVIDWIVNKAARGNSSLVGGSLSIAGPGGSGIALS